MPEEMSYRAAGVDIDAAGAALRAVLPAIRGTQGEEVIGGVGGFGALFAPRLHDYSMPLLVASIDGVGTKTKVAHMVGKFDGLGFDIVNHCVNDILCQGARPLFFLDYYGTSRLSSEIFTVVLSGMAAACHENGCALVGGETAEMPGVYVDEEFDIVGSIVGVVDHSRRLPRGTVSPGDVVIGLASDGLHTNGFTLARKVLFETGGMSVRDPLPLGENGETVGEALMRPHRSYKNAVMPLIDQEITGCLAHITGGGLYDNMPRVLPGNVRVTIDRSSWPVPPIFRLIQELGDIPQSDMYRTFNMGIGMTMVVSRQNAEIALRLLAAEGQAAWVIGEVREGPSEIQIA